MNQGARRPFAVFDIDGTVIRWQLYHAIVNQLIKQGALPQQVAEAIHDARMTWKRRTHNQSFAEYERTLVHAYHDALEHLRAEQFSDAVDAVFEEYKDQVYTYTRDLIRDLKAQGYLLFAISGSHQEIISKLAEYYGFDAAVGQQYEQQNGTFTGEHTMPMHHKDTVLAELVTEYNATRQGSIAVGDSEGDIAMLEKVEQPIAFNPSAGLAAHAKTHHWQIVIERKNIVYNLEPRNGSYVLAETSQG